MFTGKRTEAFQRHQGHYRHNDGAIQRLQGEQNGKCRSGRAAQGACQDGEINRSHG